MEYKILADTEPNLLEKRVNEHIQEGWQPLGGIAIPTDNEGEFYFQAMIKKPDK